MAYDPSKYDPVDARLERFWQEHPSGRIETWILTDPAQLDEVVVRACVWFDISEEHPRGAGHAFERRGGSGANQASHLENAETSAIGRALANAGYKARKDAPRPSREEMQKTQPESRGDARAADHSSVGAGERGAIVAEIGDLFKELHEGEPFYPWAQGVLKREERLDRLPVWDIDDLKRVKRHLTTEKAAREGQQRQGGGEPPAMLQGA